jgi:predicted acetyltransferase
MHDLTIELAKPDEKALLSRLLQLYFFDSTPWSGEDIQEDGRYECNDESLLNYSDSTDSYCAYILRVDGKPAGFALLEDQEFQGKQLTEFADLFVLPKYRRLGVGSAVVTKLVLDSERTWLFAIFRNDLQALRYWQSSFKRLPFRSVRATEDPEDDRFHLFIINESKSAGDASQETPSK